MTKLKIFARFIDGEPNETLKLGSTNEYFYYRQVIDYDNSSEILIIVTAIERCFIVISLAALHNNYVLATVHK